MSAVGTARIATQELFQARKEAQSWFLCLHEDLLDVGSMWTVGFLLEQQTWPELEDLVEVGKLALATLPEQDPELYNLTSPDTYIAQMWARRGHYRLAIEVMVSARNMKLKAPQDDHQNLSWMANNISAFYSCLGEYETALEWQGTSRTSWERWAKSENVEFHWHPNQRYGRGRTLAYMKRYDEARTDIDISLEDMMTTKPVIWGTAGPCQFARARLAMFEGDFKLAELLFQKAQSIWLTGNSSRTSDFYAATIYRMGCCALLEGEVEQAVKYLQDAMAITSLRKDIQVGEHARCLYKLSEGLYQIPGRELEADRLLKEAEELYWKRVEKPKGVSEEDHAEYEVPQIHPQEEDYDSLVYMLWR
ncbi:Tetratricopeptide-like helical [Colletotrichum scovillei]|uniref:Tetratricopeptide-like helical n=1 Tax=Colletotrichum scovillei TaxID=1209932 RepID=A0A9P7UBL0_9PEZI|nr:Tetratricopeptide-like helical [Colletotrichum scovillei]KAG7065845.1 Tetratricopeptide-like helical [Colletotrichum scovillei]KAG7068449.1 Tetratricopeptide-like helical [Colletotrichum scovillei]